MFTRIDTPQLYLDLDVVLKNFKDKLYGLSLVGSRLHQTNRPDSDYDYVAVTDGWSDLILSKHYNITVYNKDSFQAALTRQNMYAIEAYLAPSIVPFEAKYIKMEEILRITTRQTVIRDMNKAERDKSTKSLFHALRIIDFTKQLIENDGIDFDCRILRDVIDSDYLTFDELYDIAKQRIQKL